MSLLIQLSARWIRALWNWQRASAAAFVDSLAPLDSRHGLIALSLGLFAIALLVPLTPWGLLNGDSALYAQQIRDHDFSSRTVHLGYFLLGSLAFLAGPVTDRVLNLLSTGFAGATIAVLYLITAKIVRDPVIAVVGALMVLGNTLFVRNAVYAEVYSSQVLFVMLAFLLWIVRRDLTSGAALGFSALISPSALLTSPGFVVLRPRTRPIIKLAAAGALVLIVALAPVARDYFSGGRGLLKAGGVWLPPSKLLLKQSYELVFGLFALLPLVAAGAWECVKQERLRAFGIAVAAIWLTTLVLGDRFMDVPAQLPTYVLMGVLGALGFGRLARGASAECGARPLVALVVTGSALPIACFAFLRTHLNSLGHVPPSVPFVLLGGLLVTGIVSLTLVTSRPKIAAAVLTAALLSVNAYLAVSIAQRKNREIEAYRATVMAVSSEVAPSDLVVGEWSPGILFEHYAFGESYTGVWVDRAWMAGAWGSKRQASSLEAWRRTLDSRDEIWLLQSYPDLVAELEGHGYEVTRFRSVYRATHTASEEGGRLDALPTSAPGDTGLMEP